MSLLDKNGNGKIDFSEFVLATLDKRSLLSREKLKKTFQLFDADKNGTLTK